jgi:hypothetical protein
MDNWLSCSLLKILYVENIYTIHETKIVMNFLQLLGHSKK